MLPKNLKNRPNAPSTTIETPSPKWEKDQRGAITFTGQVSTVVHLSGESKTTGRPWSMSIVHLSNPACAITSQIPGLHFEHGAWISGEAFLDMEANVPGYRALVIFQIAPAAPVSVPDNC